MKRVLALLSILGCFGVAAPPADAQTAAATGILRITVVDPSSAVVPGATVTVKGIDDVTKAAAIDPATSGDGGIAVFAGLKPGRYSVIAELQGFEPRVLPDVRVRTGENKQVAVLA